MYIALGIILGVQLFNTVMILILQRRVAEHTEVIAVLCRHRLTDMLDNLFGEVLHDEEESND